MNLIHRLASRFRYRPWGSYPVITGLAATTVALMMMLLGAWEPLDRSAYNTLLRIQARLHPLVWDDRIVVLAIDEASLAEYGPFPWPRDRYVALLNALLPAQPAAIGLDLIMTEATVHDARLAASIRDSGNVVMAVGDDGSGKALDISPTIANPAAGSFLLGHVKHLTDADGISRQVWLYEGHFPSLSIALLKMYDRNLTNTLGSDVPEPPAIPRSYLEPESPVQQQLLWLNWPGRIHPRSKEPGTLTVFSFVDVLKGRLDLSLLQNKIILVGVTAVGLEPLRTPFHTRIPTSGIYYHATVLDNLLGDRFLHRWPESRTAGLVAILGVTTSLVLSRLGPRVRLVLLIGIVPLGLAIAYFNLLSQNLLPVAAPIGACLISAFSLQFAEQRERQSLMDLLALNTSPEMADLMWRNKADILDRGQIQPRELTATVLFADIRSFTRITETLPSDILLPWLNRYFEVMTDCIMAQGGVVDKYIGDAVMAVFGVPLPHTRQHEIQHDAVAAVRAGLAMHHELQVLNKEFTANGLPTIRFGVGIHTGKVIAGTVGSRQRISYSIFGDTVNVAARIQDMTKSLSAYMAYPILLSEETYDQTKDVYAYQTVGEMKLRGRATLSQIYTFKDDKDDKGDKDDKDNKKRIKGAVGK